MSATITYLPASGLILKGAHESMDPSAEVLGEFHPNRKTTWTSQGEVAQLKASEDPKTHIHNPELRRLARSIANNRIDIKRKALNAADYQAQRDNLEHLILIRLHQQLQGEQFTWFWLDEMYNEMQLDQLLYRMSFRDNPAAAQEVPRRGEYDTNKVEYDEIEFLLKKYVVSYDIPIEDPLMALINPVIPLEQNMDWSMKYLRENKAKEGLEAIGNYYDKSETGADAFEGTSAPSSAGKISNPNTLDSNGFHSKDKVVNELQIARNEFLKTYDLPLTHFACSPKTAFEIAQNTWTENNTIFNVEAYRTNGGVRSFPGLANATLVISLILPDNKIYAINKPSSILTKAEGPKITRSWEDNTRWTNQTATADFFQYKSAHEDLTMDRKFGVIFSVDTS